MTYIKILDGEGSLRSVEAIEEPIYAARQSNGVIACQCPAHRAQGILSADNTETYQLSDRDSLGGDFLTAIIITRAEYDELLTQAANAPDPEDEAPEVPEETPETTILTRAELTAKVTSLEAENAELREAIEALVNGVTSDE